MGKQKENQKPVVGTKLLTPAQAAAMIGWHPVTLSNKRCKKRGGPPYVKVDGSVRYPQNLLEEWLNQHDVVAPENERVA